MVDKLTVPQLLALIDLSEAPQAWASHWRPIQILVQRGYAVEKKGLFHHRIRPRRDNARENPMTSDKLTAPQRFALIELSEAPRPYASHWKPIQILVQRGLAAERGGLFYITPEGSALIAQGREEMESGR